MTGLPLVVTIFLHIAAAIPFSNQRQPSLRLLTNVVVSTEAMDRLLLTVFRTFLLHRSNLTPGSHRTAKGTVMISLTLVNLCSHEISQTPLLPEVSVWIELLWGKSS